MTVATVVTEDQVDGPREVTADDILGEPGRYGLGWRYMSVENDAGKVIASDTPVLTVVNEAVFIHYFPGKLQEFGNATLLITCRQRRKTRHNANNKTPGKYDLSQAAMQRELVTSVFYSAPRATGKASVKWIGMDAIEYPDSDSMQRADIAALVDEGWSTDKAIAFAAKRVSNLQSKAKATE